jgi:hypothetical protein
MTDRPEPVMEYDWEHVLDAFMALQITNRFDIRLDYKNISNTRNLFDTSLTPPSLLVTVRWDFLN